MKKIVALILALVCVFSFASCDDECEKHIDADENGKCDVCEADYTCPGHVDADANGVCDECSAPYEEAPAADTLEAALATLLHCYENSAPTKVVTEVERTIGEGAYTLDGLYTLVTGTYAGKLATVYIAEYEELRTVEEGVDDILSEIKPMRYVKEFLEGRGVREDGGDWKSSGLNFAPSAGDISLNISLDLINNPKFTNEKYNNTFSFVVPKENIKSVFGATDGKANIEADSNVRVSITNNGATITSVTITYSVSADDDIPRQAVTMTTTYSYNAETVSIDVDAQ